jgi:small GTP-binding protein
MSFQILAPPPHKRDYKVLTIGNSSVGKTNFMSVSTGLASFNEQSKATVGVSFSTRKVMVKGQLVPVSIWDTAGQERYKSLTVAYFRGSDGVFLCFSLTDAQSFSDLKGWNQDVIKFCPPHVVRMVVGMKLDLCGEDGEYRAVSAQEAEDYAASIGASYCETSSKTGMNLSFALGR